MLFYIFSFAFCFAFGLSASGELTLPVITCKRDSANYSACLKSALEEAFPRFLPGLPEFDFPPLDPLVYEHEKFKFDYDEVRGEIIISNLTLVGFSKARFLDVRPHFLDDVFRLEIDILVPKLFGEGDVSVDSTINVFKINDKGHINFTMEDIRGTADIRGPVINDTWIVERFYITPSIKKLKVYFVSYLEQNNNFSNLVLAFVNEFWPILYRIMLPIAADTWEPWLTTFPNKLLSKIPFSKIFP